MSAYNKSYSQVAEDLITAYLLGGLENKTYVDVGCLWPIRQSNTYLFYEHGGQGLCIDANPDVATLFRSYRERDIFVNSGVSREAGTLTFYRFENPVFSTFEFSRAKRVLAKGRPGCRLVSEEEVQVKPLSQILEETGFLDRTGGDVDFMSIDVEGGELGVLDGVDFKKFCPSLVIVETVKGDSSLKDSAVVNRLQEACYELAAFTGHDAFFRKKRNNS